MDHAGEGRLLAFMDGQLNAADQTAVQTHLASCPACSEELSTLREAAARLSASLRLLDATAPAPAAPALVLARARSVRVAAVRRTLLRAAGIVLVLAAGGAAALPGSPLREWARAAWDRGAALFGGGAAVEAEAEAPTAPAARATPAGISAAPANGRIRVALVDLPAGTEVQVRLVDAPSAWVEAPDAAASPPRFVRGPGLVEVSGGAVGVVRIDLPRAVPEARVEVDGRLRVYKDGGVLRLVAGGPDDAGPQAVFRIGR